MEITFNEISPILNLYSEKIKDLDGQKLPLEIAFKMATIFREFSIYQNFFQERMENIISNYGLKDEEGNLVFTDETKQMVRLRPESINIAKKELAELEGMKKTINAEPISLSELETLKEILTVEDLIILSPIIEK